MIQTAHTRTCHQSWKAASDAVQVEVTEVPAVQTRCLSGGQYESTISLNLRNTGETAIRVPYKVSVRNLEYIGASNPFNLALTGSKAQNGWAVWLLLFLH